MTPKQLPTLLSVTAVMFTLVATGQEHDTSTPDFEQLVEDFYNDDSASDFEQLADEYQWLREHPLNVNTATADELAVLRFLTPLQINAIVNYRSKYGRILSVQELGALPEIDRPTMRILQQLLSFTPDKTPYLSRYMKHQLLLRGAQLLEEQQAFTQGKYEGSPLRLNMRYRFQSASIQAGLTGDKDAGESFFRASNPAGFDFYSAFIRYAGKNIDLIVGDYIAQFGQGLVIAQGFSIGKSASTTAIGNFNNRFRGYTSSMEGNFMRGLSATLRAGRMTFAPFVSSRMLDGNLKETDGEMSFASIQTSGYHRTEGEIEDKHAVRNTTFGGNTRFDGTHLSVGLTGVHTHYSYPLRRGNTSGYNQYLFQGKNVSNVGLDYRWGANGWYAFGETATDGDGWAQLAGAIHQPLDMLELAAIYRNISKRYSSPWANTFTESSQANDEEGFYIGAKLLPLSGVTVNAAADFFRYRHIKYTTAGPGRGHEFITRINYAPSSQWQAELRWFYERKPLRYSWVYTSINVPQVRQSIRLSLTGSVGKYITLKSRIEQSIYRHDTRSAGFYIGQDVGLRPPSRKWNIWLRTAYFDTADYDSRIYAYENDLLYSFSIPANYGQGIRTYITGKIKLGDSLEIWYKISRTWMLDAETIGSGDSLINSPHRTEAKIQVRLTI
ncbi:MAG: helix-hairpin-helix domain-containing protein [Bacteroidales bacterium]|jgi:hypothetical protein|nr:helix-hairpin-helix domain-containing protein [Bacteroidales bacterium]